MSGESRPLISVIVPVYNAERYLTQCCEALLDQTYPLDRYEILMVDNNSTDRSYAVIAEFVRKSGRIQLLSEPEQGSYAARNLALRQANGRILAFTDPDCVPHRDWLSRIEEDLRDEKIQIVLGDRLFATSMGTLGCLEAYESAMAARVYEKGEARHYYAYTNNMGIRRAVFDAIGEFERLARGADSRFLHRALQQLGGPSIVRYDPAIVVRHLEIESVGNYLEKKYEYGRVTGSHTGFTGFPAGLPFRERMQLARKVIREHPVVSTIGFGAALAAGAVLFEWSRRKAADQKPPQK